MKFLRLPLILICLFFSLKGFSQTFKDYDTNNDGRIDMKEFGHTYELGRWDENHDNQISEHEFYSGVFSQLDTSEKDGFISLIEWANATKGMYGDYIKKGNLKKLDTNHNNKLSPREFIVAFSNSDLYRKFDANHDGHVVKSEFNKQYFKLNDKNNNGYLDKNEYGNPELPLN